VAEHHASIHDKEQLEVDCLVVVREKRAVENLATEPSVVERRTGERAWWSVFPPRPTPMGRASRPHHSSSSLSRLPASIHHAASYPASS
jgi:hypothetical protein